MTSKFNVITPEDTAEILKDTFTIDQFTDRFIDKIWEGGYHVRYDTTVSDYLKLSVHDFRNPLIFQSEYIKTRTGLTKGNFFITSNREIFDKISFSRYTISPQYKYLVDSRILRPSTIVMGSYPLSSFLTPLVLSPIIDKKDYDMFLKSRNISFSNEIPSKMRYPIIENKLKEYKVLEEYIHYAQPERYYLHTVYKNIRPFYTIIHFEKGLYY